MAIHGVDSELYGAIFQARHRAPNFVCKRLIQETEKQTDFRFKIHYFCVKLNN